MGLHDQPWRRPQWTPRTSCPPAGWRRRPVSARRPCGQGSGGTAGWVRGTRTSLPSSWARFLHAFVPDDKAQAPGGLLVAVAGERHGLSLLMVELVCRSQGMAVRNLGVDLPEDEILAMVRDVKPRFIGMTVSLATGGSATDRRLAGPSR